MRAYKNAITDLYNEGDCLNLAYKLADEIDDEQADELYNKFVKAIEALYSRYNGEISPDNISDDDFINLTLEINAVLQKAAAQGISLEIPADLRTKLEKNIFVFSQVKTIAELQECSALIVNEKGGFKPFRQFLDDVKKVHEDYNVRYLEAEYNYAVSSCQMASKWQEYEKAGDRYNLQYRTAADEKVRETHAVLNMVTLPLSDKFWDKYLPPLGWNCRCDTVQVRKGKFEESNSEAAQELGNLATLGAKNAIFRYNVGKTLEVYPPKHPYFKTAELYKDTINDIFEKNVKKWHINDQD